MPDILSLHKDLISYSLLTILLIPEWLYPQPYLPEFLSLCKLFNSLDCYDYSKDKKQYCKDQL